MSDLEKIRELEAELQRWTCSHKGCTSGLAHDMKITAEKDEEIASLKVDKAQFGNTILALEKEVERLKNGPKIMVADFEIALPVFRQIVERIGSCWGSPSHHQSIPDEISYSAILKWQLDKDGLYSITSGGKKVRLSKTMPAMKIALVKE